VEAVGTARLTDEIPAPHAVAASVSRRAITDILNTDGVPELTLDVVSPDRAERGTISMTWSREDLQRLLDAASGDEVVLTFDGEELASFLGDVEAHGLRTRAAVFAVAAMGTLGTGASIANAMVVGDGGGNTASTPIAATSDASSALQARSEAMNQQYGLGAGGAADALQARSEALNEQYGLGSAGKAAAARALEARGAAMNAAYGLGDEATASQVTDVSSAGGYGTGPAASSGTFDIQSPSAEDALIAGGVLLTIAGAAFAVRRGTASPRPA
jgi:hypothetical protein